MNIQQMTLLDAIYAAIVAAEAQGDTDTAAELKRIYDAVEGRSDAV